MKKYYKAVSYNMLGKHSEHITAPLKYEVGMEIYAQDSLFGLSFCENIYEVLKYNNEDCKTNVILEVEPTDQIKPYDPGYFCNSLQVVRIVGENEVLTNIKNNIMKVNADILAKSGHFDYEILSKVKKGKLSDAALKNIYLSEKLTNAEKETVYKRFHISQKDINYIMKL